MLETAQHLWHPVAAAGDLPFRHVFHGQLLGREFAIWRADDGYVNVWENRCLHRGVRLSIGTNDGRELKCRYHGWRYANRTAGCTYIPAHPADAPARTICNRTYPAVERYGLVWSGEAPDGDVPDLPISDADHSFALRGVPVNAPADLIVEMLSGYRFQPSDRIVDDGAELTAQPLGDFGLALRAEQDGSLAQAVFLVQPVDSNRSVIRGVLDRTPDPEIRLEVLRHHNGRLGRLRDRIESVAAGRPAPAPLQPVIERVSVELASLPGDAAGRRAALRVQVARKWQAGQGIAGFELAPLEGQLPTYQAGAHIDVHMPNGQIRQYSITNGPGQLESYVIGVKLEPESKGGSQCMHETVREGDVLAISEPRNNFPLRRDATKTVLVAGGIGITPLLAMARTLHHSKLNHELHCFAQSAEHLAFGDILASMADSVHTHLGLDPDATGKCLETILGGYTPSMHFYVCGPGPMLEAARRIAGRLGWPEAAIHFEYFKNTNEIDDSSAFEIDLARSCLTLQVPPGKSIVDVLRENNVDVPTSCEQGACGTCLTKVLEGEPDHQDVYLSDGEKRSGDVIMACVSRARSGRLVLDI